MYFTGKFRDAAHSICNLRHSIPRKIPVLIHNGSSYDFYLIIKHLAHEFENSMFRGEYRKIYFPVMPEKEYIYKKVKTKTNRRLWLNCQLRIKIFWRLQIYTSIVISLSYVTDNLSEKLHKNVLNVEIRVELMKMRLLKNKDENIKKLFAWKF